MLKNYTKNGFIFIYLFYLVPIVHTLAIEKEINKVCEDGDYSSYERKTSYSTLKEFFNDQINFDVSSKDYFIPLMTQGTSYIQNIMKIIKYIIPTIIMFSFAIITMITYFIFLCVWSKNCCVLKKYNEYERLKKQSDCKYCGYITFILMILISLTLCVFAVLNVLKIKKTTNASLCTLYQFTNHSLNGTSEKDRYPYFPGYEQMIQILTNTSNGVVSLFSSMSSLFPKYSDIISLDSVIMNKIQELSDTYKVSLIQTPNPNYSNNIFTLYQSLYTPYTDSMTMLGNLYKDYTENTHTCVEYLTKVYNDLINIYNYRKDIKYDINSINSKIKDFYELYVSFDNIVNTNYKNIKNNINQIVGFSIFIGCGLVVFETLILFFFSSIFVCSESSSSCMYYIRKTFIVFWHFLFISTAIIFVLCGFVFFFFTINRGIVSSLNYILSEEYMGNSTDKNNIFLKTIKKIPQASTYFYNCLNSEKSIDANIAYHFNFETTYLKYLNTLYSDYIKFYYYYSNLETELENIEVLKRNNEILTSYINDISLTTSYLKHGENDVSYTLNLLNQYSDTSFEGSKQIKCITQTNDRWVSNINNCPSDYTHLDPEESYSFGKSYCLVINEWTFTQISYKYESTCKTYNNENVDQFIQFYFTPIKNYYDNNKNVINGMIEGNNYLYNTFKELVNDIKIEYQSDYTILDKLLSGFIENNGLTLMSASIFDMFECDLLRYDIIDFYDLSKNQFEKEIIIEILFLTVCGVLLYISQYFGIRLMFIFNKDFKMKEEEDESSAEDSNYDKNNKNEEEEDEDIYEKNKKVKQPINEIKKKKEKPELNRLPTQENYITRKLNTAGSENMLLLTQNLNDPNKVYSLENLKNLNNNNNNNNNNNKNDNNNNNNNILDLDKTNENDKNDMNLSNYSISNSNSNPMYSLKNKNKKFNDNNTNANTNILQNSKDLVYNGVPKNLYSPNPSPLGNLMNKKKNSNTKKNDDNEEKKDNSTESI